MIFLAVIDTPFGLSMLCFAVSAIAFVIRSAKATVAGIQIPIRLHLDGSKAAGFLLTNNNNSALDANTV